MKYLGNTQQFMKKRIQTHMTETRKLYCQGIKSDSFASHFAKQIPDKTTRDEIKFDMKVTIKWQGNPLTCVKTFGTHKCKLCMKEKIHILPALKDNPEKTINSRTKIYGACLHKTRFHHLECNTPASTDESIEDERVLCDEAPDLIDYIPPFRFQFRPSCSPKGKPKKKKIQDCIYSKDFNHEREPYSDDRSPAIGNGPRLEPRNKEEQNDRIRELRREAINICQAYKLNEKVTDSSFMRTTPMGEHNPNEEEMEAVTEVKDLIYV